jgi:anti-sigma B factor antagonist
MKTRVESLGPITVVISEGRLDFGAAGAFQTAIEQALTGATALIIDCAGLEYVSSAGLRVFLLAARSSQSAGRPFALCTLKPAVREVFDVSGFSRVIAVHADRESAVAQIQQRSV